MLHKIQLIYRDLHKTQNFLNFYSKINYVIKQIKLLRKYKKYLT